MNIISKAMNIKDFWDVFIESYRRVNKEKIEAKKILKQKKVELKKFQENLKDIKIAQTYLSKIYLLLDENERKTSVQQTIDLIEYGPRSSQGNRYWGDRNYYQKKYEQLITFTKTHIHNIKEYINEGRYNEVLRYNPEIKDTDNDT